MDRDRMRTRKMGDKGGDTVGGGRFGEEFARVLETRS